MRVEPIALRTALWYGLFGALWIVGSDALLVRLISDPEDLSRASTWKGWFFVAVTAGLLYLFLARELRRRAASERALREAREATERTLAETVARFEDMAANIGEGFWSIPVTEGTPVYGSPAMATMRGLAPGALPPEPEAWQAAVLPEDRAILDDGRARLLAGEIFEIEFRLRRADGEVRWIRSRGYPQLGPDGRVARVFGVDSDITERKRAETRIRQLSRAVEQSVNSVVITDPEGHIEYVNPRFCHVTGYGVAEVVGRNPRFLKSGETPPEVYGDLWRTIRAGGEWHGEFHNRRKDGTLYWELASISPIVDAQGRIEHFLGVKEDITARKHAEMMLRESEDRFRALVEHLPGGLLVHDGLRILYVNPSAMRLLGADSPGELIGSKVLDRVHPDDRALVIDRVARSMQRGRPVPPSEVRLIRLDARPLDAEVSAAPYRFGGVPAMIVFFRDVGDRKALEAQLRQAQKLEAIGTLAGGVAHDFNNILTVIKSNLTLLSELPDEERPSLLNEVVEASDRATSLTRQLLLFSRRETMHPVALDLSDVVANLSKMLRRLLREDITYRTELAPGLAAVRGDVGMVEQVVLNLVVNARDAMPVGGTLTIHTYATEANGAPRVAISVADTGTGIPPEVLPHIFEPFFTTKGVGKGTGLGLATVYGIVEQHGGTTTIQTELGVGTTVTATFPSVATRVDGTPRPTLPPVMPRGRETILLVEDEEAVRRTAAAVLQRCGYEVINATSGDHALEVWRARAAEIDLVLTDLVMPGRLNGHALAAEIRTTRPDARILFSSGYSATLADERTDLVEGHNFLPKPYDASRLAELVRKMLDS